MHCFFYQHKHQLNLQKTSYAFLLQGSPDPLRDYSDNEIGSLDGIWNEIASSEGECDIENVELDEDEEEDLVELEDQFPSDEEDFVELENPMWDNSAMRNWSDFDEVKEQLLKREEEYAAPEGKFCNF